MTLEKRLTFFNPSSMSQDAARFLSCEVVDRASRSQSAPPAPSGTVPTSFRTATPPTRFSILSEAPLG